jgi:hypothetical protein
VDLFGTIQQLHAERKKILELIRAMEALPQSGSFLTRERAIRRRGRKSMDEAERQRVSARMKKYWASRRSEPQEDQSWAATG